MQHYTSRLPATDSFLLIDEEFDRFDVTPPSAGNTAVEPTLLADDLAWDDQIDNGNEPSL